MSDSKSHRRYISEKVSEIPRSGIRDFFDIVSTTRDAISLGVGEPGFATPWHIRDASIYSLEKGATGYTSNLGLTELRTGIANYVAETFDVRYDPLDEILITTGVSEGLDLAIRAVVDPGDEVIFHEPCYVSYKPVIQLAHGVPVTVETSEEREFEPSLDAIEAKVTERTKALILSYPNNPTGATLSRPVLNGIAELARKRNFLIISDEIYGELTYNGQHQSIASLPGMKDRTIFLHGFSKAWAMTGFRIGYCCAPAVLTDAMMNIHQYTMLCAPILSQAAALAALRRVDVDVPEMKKQYRSNRNFLLRSLVDMKIPCVYPTGAFYAFPYIGELGLTSQEFALGLLQSQKVAVVPGPAFGACGEGYIRCSFATSLEDLKEAVLRMSRFVSEVRIG
jgi:aminotransferase